MKKTILKATLFLLCYLLIMSLYVYATEALVDQPVNSSKEDSLMTFIWGAYTIVAGIPFVLFCVNRKDLFWTLAVSFVLDFLVYYYVNYGKVFNGFLLIRCLHVCLFMASIHFFAVGNGCVLREMIQVGAKTFFKEHIYTIKESLRFYGIYMLIILLCMVAINGGLAGILLGVGFLFISTPIAAYNYGKRCYNREKRILVPVVILGVEFFCFLVISGIVSYCVGTGSFDGGWTLLEAITYFMFMLFAIPFSMGGAVFCGILSILGGYRAKKAEEKNLACAELEINEESTSDLNSN